LQEAGVKIDLAAGRGAGVASALFFSIDGAARLWEDAGVWSSPSLRAFYHWKPLLRAAGWMAAVLFLILLTPLLLLAAGLVVYPAGFVLSLLGLDTGAAFIAWYSGTLQAAFAGGSLPTVVPRLAMLVLLLLLGLTAGGVLLARWRAPVTRREEGGWWWRVAGAPLDADTVRRTFIDAIWQLIRGASPPEKPSMAAIGRRYAEVLGENLGQPGFAELVLMATDLDARRDMVGALLREPHRREFFASRPGRDRGTEAIDLAAAGAMHVADLVSAALTPPLVCDPALVTFASDSFWRGETHRLCDRAGASSRLLEEVAAAGVSQVIVVSAVGPSAIPHALTPPRLDLRSRLGEFIAAAECAGLRDALEAARLRFDGVHVIYPRHNAVGPFDVEGAYDRSSDRRQEIGELMDRATEDAYRQFIEPVVGASGEHLARPAHEGALGRLGPADQEPLFERREP
jgi:hypothetical protein